MSVLAIDIGGTNIKLLVSGQQEPRRFPSGPTLSPRQLVDGVKKLAADWKYNVVSIGYPGVVVRDRILAEPHNLAQGWVGFNFKAAFRRPVKIINDAAMQALGSYKKGQMLFLGLGTGLGSAMVVEGIVVPMELGHLSYRNGTYEDYVGRRGLRRLGKKKWRKHVTFFVSRLISALQVDDVVLGGGNATHLNKVPPGCRLGKNSYAFIGGFRLWEESGGPPKASRAKPRSSMKRRKRRAPARRAAAPHKQGRGLQPASTTASKKATHSTAAAPQEAQPSAI